METWLLPGICDAAVSVRGYTVARTDTTGVHPKHGVLFYVNNKVSFYSVHCNCPNVHIIFLVQFGIFVVLVYRPPGSGAHENDVLINFLVDFCVGKEAVVMGDFNLPDIKWSQSDYVF